jgi:hypothetical protein
MRSNRPACAHSSAACAAARTTAARVLAALLALIGLSLLSAEATATTKGLSQIVTPDVQPEGELSLSFQAQASRIGNPYQLQAELGLTKWLEVAVFEGLSPDEQVLGTQIALLQRETWLLTTGFINWSTRGASPQPFLEAGYYTEHDKFMAGPIRIGDRTEILLGWAHDFNSRWRVQFDYESGADNYFTAGFTCNVTARWQVNPAIYISNDRAHTKVGYFVLTYTLPFGHR